MELQSCRGDVWLEKHTVPGVRILDRGLRWPQFTQLVKERHPYPRVPEENQIGKLCPWDFTVDCEAQRALAHAVPVLSFLICEVEALLGKKNRAGNSKLSRGSI